MSRRTTSCQAAGERKEDRHGLRNRTLGAPEAIMGIPSDRRLLAGASEHLRHLLPPLPGQAGCFQAPSSLATTRERPMSVFRPRAPVRRRSAPRRLDAGGSQDAGCAPAGRARAAPRAIRSPRLNATSAMSQSNCSFQALERHDARTLPGPRRASGPYNAGGTTTGVSVVAPVRARHSRRSSSWPALTEAD